MKRRCFYSFHYSGDCQRAALVRQIGAIEGNRLATDNEWESVTKGGDSAIKRWICNEMLGKSCTIVLVGSGTANRKWINYEIVESWNAGMGIVGIRVHGLKNLAGLTSPRGQNPFDYVTHVPTQRALSAIVKCYEPVGATSKEKYGWICKHLANAVEEGIRIRGAHD